LCIEAGFSPAQAEAFICFTPFHPWISPAPIQASVLMEVERVKDRSKAKLRNVRWLVKYDPTLCGY
jgi:hypothetical protein